MEYNFQKAIESQQRFQMKNPDIEWIHKDELLFLIEAMEKIKVNNLESEDFRISVIVRAEKAIREIESEIKREDKDYGKYREDYYTPYFLKNKTKTCELLCISRPTLDSWIKKGIVSVREYPNCKRKDIDLRQIPRRLRFVKYI